MADHDLGVGGYVSVGVGEQMKTMLGLGRRNGTVRTFELLRFFDFGT